jgi:hypothetical protein
MDTGTLTTLLTPIAGLWGIHNAIFSSAAFVNKMRETVITGAYEGQTLTRTHQRAIFIDWVLCMLAVVTVCLIFAGVVLAVALTLAAAADAKLMKWAGIAIAAYPAICAILFSICSIADALLMLEAISRNRLDVDAHEPNRPNQGSAAGRRDSARA